MGKLLLSAFIVIPAFEIGVLVLAGNTIGIAWTIGLIILTGIIGAYLARHQGLAVLQQAQTEIHQRFVPGESILDGICVLAGALLLLTPGFITDTIGFLLLVPATRRPFKKGIKLVIKKGLENGRFTFIRY